MNIVRIRTTRLAGHNSAVMPVESPRAVGRDLLKQQAAKIELRLQHAERNVPQPTTISPISTMVAALTASRPADAGGTRRAAA